MAGLYVLFGTVSVFVIFGFLRLTVFHSVVFIHHLIMAI